MECFVELPVLLTLAMKEMQQNGQPLAEFPFIDVMLREQAMSSASSTAIQRAKPEQDIAITKEHISMVCAPLNTSNMP